MFSHLFNTYEAVIPPPKSKQDFKQEIYQEPDSDTLIIDPLGLGPISRVPYVDKPSDQPFVPESQPDFVPDEVPDTPEYSTSNQLITNVINTGRSFVGGKYVSGGTSPETGFDCSGFLQYIFKQNGVDIPRNTAGIFKVGKEVSLNNVQPGDIICSRGSGPSGRHVQMVSRVDPESNQIYVIEAKGRKYGIVEGPLTKKSSDIISIRRVLNQNSSDPFLANQDIQSVRTSSGKFSTRNFDEFVSVMYPIFEASFKKYNLPITQMQNVLRQAAYESGYGTNPRGAQGYNLGGIKWENNPNSRTYNYKHTTYPGDGIEYVDFDSLQDYADYKIFLLNDTYHALDAPNTNEFVERLHGKNPSKKSYSANKNGYRTTLNTMRSLDKAYERYVSGRK